MHKIPESELIINPDNTIYHLNMHPSQLAENIILVGDPSRVEMVSKYFDKIEHRTSNREFIAHTGNIGNLKVTVLSTGIGTDNIDIVLNELDALVNIDFETRKPRTETVSLNLIRIGTSGSLQADIEPGSFVFSRYALGMDGLLHYYEVPVGVLENHITKAFLNNTFWHSDLPAPYFVKSSDNLFSILGSGMLAGITATAPGFYAPQGRHLRLRPAFPLMNKCLSDFSHEGFRINNFEMETSALYGLGKALGHQAATVCVVVANRHTKSTISNYHLKVDELIRLVLERMEKSGM